MIVTVTQQDIDQGRRHSPSCCPVALALKRATGAESVSVLPPWLTCYHGPPVEMHAHWIQTPNPVTQFVRDFDRHQPVAPFQFEIPDPPEV